MKRITLRKVFSSVAGQGRVAHHSAIPGATGAVRTLRLLSRARTLTSPRGVPVPPASGDRRFVLIVSASVQGQ